VINMPGDHNIHLLAFIAHVASSCSDE